MLAKHFQKKLKSRLISALIFPVTLLTTAETFAQVPSLHHSQLQAANPNESAASSTATANLGAVGTCSGNVKSYGAAGDGSADDTAAIRSALNANSGGTVCFPSGVYQISQCLLIPNHSTLAGSGAVNAGWATTSIRGTVIRLTSAGTAACMITPANIKDGNYQDFSVRDMVFDGGAGNGGYVETGGAYIDLQNTYDMTSLSLVMIANFLNAPGIRIGPGLGGIGTGPIMKLDQVWINGFTEANKLGASNGFNNQVGLEIDNYYSSPSNTGWVNGGVVSNVEISGTGTAPGVHVKSVSSGGIARWFTFQGLTIFGLANASTPAVQIDGMANSTFRDTFVGLPANGTAFLITNTPGHAASTNLLFQGIYGDGAPVTLVNDQTKGTTMNSSVGTYMLQ